MKIKLENWKTTSFSISAVEHTINTRVTLRAGHFGVSLLVNKELVSVRQQQVIAFLAAFDTMLLGIWLA